MSNKFRVDPWLTELLDRPALYLDCEVSTLQLSDFPNEKSFISTKIKTKDSNNLAKLQSLGFRVVDVNIQFLKNGPIKLETKSLGTVRFAEPKDESCIRKIARTSFLYDRFHSDTQIPPFIADNIKEEWAANFFLGKRGNKMFVIDVNNTVCGFLLLLDNIKSITIDLIGVTKEYQGKGLSSQMIMVASKLLMNESKNKILVGTQLANLPSIRLYTKLGFIFNESFYVLHRH